MGAITPYILPSTLINSPTGIDWNTLPVVGATAAAQLAAQYQMCLRATHAAEAFCNQVLRATIDIQIEDAPHRRCAVDGATGVAKVQTEQWPVLAVVSAQYWPAGIFPSVPTVLTSTQYDIGYAVPMNTGSAIPGGSAQGGNIIRIAPGVVTWGRGRRGTRVQVQYLNGWPHCGLTASCIATATTLQVDDVTGWTIASVTNPIGATLEDGASTENISVIGTTPTGIGSSGPGTLTLSAGTAFAHAGPVSGIPSCLVTTMPFTIHKAIVWLAISESLIRGATFISVPNLPGTETHSGSGEGLDMMAFEALLPFKRVI